MTNVIPICQSFPLFDTLNNLIWTLLYYHILIFLLPGFRINFEFTPISRAVKAFILETVDTWRLHKKWFFYLLRRVRKLGLGIFWSSRLLNATNPLWTSTGATGIRNTTWYPLVWPAFSRESPNWPGRSIATMVEHGRDAESSRIMYQAESCMQTQSLCQYFEANSPAADGKKSLQVLFHYKTSVAAVRDFIADTFGKTVAVKNGENLKTTRYFAVFK